jgi:hypothetical protein
MARLMPKAKKGKGGVEKVRMALHGGLAALHVVLLIKLIDNGNHGMKHIRSLHTLIIITGLSEFDPADQTFPKGPLVKRRLRGFH